MEEIVIDSNLSKKEKYEILIPQIKALIEDEPDLIANMANMAAALKECFNFLWVGFYLMKEEELVLGPFQGPIACTRIALNKGVCGAAASQQKSIVVPDVLKFPGHIACSSLSKSEIVIPKVKQNKTLFVLDVDSICINAFDATDLSYLESLVSFL